MRSIKNSNKKNTKKNYFKKQKKIYKNNKKINFYKSIIIFIILFFCFILSFTLIISINQSKYFKNNIKKLNELIKTGKNNIKEKKEIINNTNINSSKTENTNINNGLITKNAHNNLNENNNEIKIDKKNKVKVCIILDDAGYTTKNLLLLKNLTNLKINISILPFLQFSVESLKIINESKNLFPLIHIPLEPKDASLISNYNNQNNYFILTNDSFDNLENKIKKIYEELPLQYANNHMGSKFSENKEKSYQILNILKSYNIRFIDSKTSNSSTFLDVSAELNYKILINNFFLDNEDNLEKIKNIFYNSIHLYKNINNKLKNNYINNNKLLEELKINNFVLIFIGHITKDNTINFLYELSNSEIINDLEFLFVNEIE
ncbi:MAG: divergent polysaccharide deacetylase family protein [Spirochaetes bacterium]|nr:divergent polysaccharide deacetylase family protein [Spirochaetota bacterium]